MELKVGRVYEAADGTFGLCVKESGPERLLAFVVPEHHRGPALMRIYGPDGTGNGVPQIVKLLWGDGDEIEDSTIGDRDNLFIFALADKLREAATADDVTKDDFAAGGWFAEQCRFALKTAFRAGSKSHQAPPIQTTN